MENIGKWAENYYAWWLKTFIIVMVLFHTVLVRFWEIYQNCSNSVHFLARQMFMFIYKWVRISPQIDWYYYHGTIPESMCIVRHQTLIKTPASWVSHQSPVCPPFTLLFMDMVQFYWKHVFLYQIMMSKYLRSVLTKSTCRRGI